jgi:hypothetical protein
MQRAGFSWQANIRVLRVRNAIPPRERMQMAGFSDSSTSPVIKNALIAMKISMEVN